VRVADGLAALQALASAWRQRFAPLVVGVTGSVGKTSTKEAAAAILGTRFRTLASAGNENNEIGLPLTLLRLGPEDEAAVLEMGMYVEGDIALLAGLARPAIGVVTAVRGVHLARAGSIEAIEREKGRLVEALPADGTAVLNADDPRVLAMRDRTAARSLTYGFGPEADVGAEAVTWRGAEGMRFVLRAAGQRLPVSTPVLGRHGVENALAAASVGLAAGLAPAEVTAGLAGGWAAKGRSVLVEAGAWRILDDSYNSGPDSMAAALDLLASLPGRRVAVLGEMLELGEASEAEHRRLGTLAVAAGVRILVTVGGEARATAAAAVSAGLPAGAVDHATDAAEATALLALRLLPGDVVLVKGSRGVELDRVVEALIQAGRASGARRGGQA
ncbi:MAG TPA: UDP-N-acetylmuramoyl-tripeptide--D-alanyl-D-alanine ligase, partial [Candidatus Limnocylindrales bacterium]|nr:UDP-N-acetylmuramoyl-tripeptide--D-alanyl-D-alanine ligase [Candidatus Limnocylindrales bacterium]